jgi:hypothetical protein
MSLLSYAENELDIIGMKEDSSDEMNAIMRKHILHMVKEFSDEGHSGFSGRYALNVLTKLLEFKPLTPLTGEDSEWNLVGDGHWQNKRCSSVFKGVDGSCYDIDGKVYWEWAVSYDDDGKPNGKAHKSYYHGYGCSTPVTFPYTPPKEPIYEYRYSDATPQQPPQNEQGFL